MKQLLRNTWEVGQINWYGGFTHVRHALPGGMPVAGPEGSSRRFNTLTEQRVLAVEEDGSAHIVSRAAIVPEGASAEAGEQAVRTQRVVTYVLLDVLGNVLQTASAAPAVACILPRDEVEEGDTWSAASNLPLPTGQMHPVELRYRLGPTENHCVTIEMSAEVRDLEVNQGQERRLVTVATRSTARFDAARGLLIAVHTHTETTARLAMQSVSTFTEMLQELIR